jgi:hypothetical protein
MSTPKYLATIIVSITWSLSDAQNFVNGDFENLIGSGCHYNLADSVFSYRMTGCKAFSNCGELDIQTHNCSYAPVPSNNFFISLSTIDSTFDQLSMQLTQNLVQGNFYSISFLHRANTQFYNVPRPLQIGLSSGSTSFGAFIQSVTPQSNIWSLTSFTFQAPVTGKYITLKMVPLHNSRAWTFVDNFQIINAPLINGLSESETGDNVLIYPNPSKGNLHISVAPELKDARVQIYSSSGNLIIDEISREQNFEVSGLSTGVYQIILSAEKKNIVRRIVVLE